MRYVSPVEVLGGRLEKNLAGACFSFELF